MLRARQKVIADNISPIETAEAQPLTRDFSRIAAPPLRACDGRRLQEAVHGLARRSPEFSASSGVEGWQATVLATLAILLCAGALLAAEPTLVVLLVLLAIPFVFVVLLRTVALWHFYSPPH